MPSTMSNPTMLSTAVRTALALALVAAAVATYAQEGPNAPAPRVRPPTAAQLLTKQERQQMHDRMLAAKSVDECRGVQEEHRKLLEQRAKDKGVQAPAPRRGHDQMCDRMQSHGRFKAHS